MSRGERAPSAKEYERIGRTLDSMIEGGHSTRWRIYKVNFIRGIFFGLGVTIGSTIFLATILWLLSLFTELPLVGDIAEALRNSVNNAR